MPWEYTSKINLIYNMIISYFYKKSNREITYSDKKIKSKKFFLKTSRVEKGTLHFSAINQFPFLVLLNYRTNWISICFKHRRRNCFCCFEAFLKNCTSKLQGYRWYSVFQRTKQSSVVFLKREDIIFSQKRFILYSYL